MIANVRARFSNGVLTPLEPLDLEEGDEVMVSIEDAPPPAKGKESILEMFERAPQIRPARGVGQYAHGWGQELQALPVRSSKG